MVIFVWLSAVVACRGTDEPSAGDSGPQTTAETMSSADTASGSTSTADTATGTTSPPTMPELPPPPPPGSCLEGVVPALPSTPRPDNGLLSFLSSGETSCQGDAWHLTALGNGHSTYFRKGVDAVTFQAWDLLAGFLVREIQGSAVDFDPDPYRAAQEWGVDLVADPVLPCSDSAQLAFTASSVMDGQDLRPVDLINPDSPVTWLGGGVYWSLTLEAKTSEEVWVWITYPHLQEAWGPFAADQEKDGDWYWELDAATEAWMNPHEAIFAVIGCSSGTPVGTTTVGAF